MATKKPATKTAKKEFQITKKRSGRYQVKKGGKIINGLPKVEILVKEGLIKTGLPKKAEEAPAEPAAT